VLDHRLRPEDDPVLQQMAEEEGASRASLLIWQAIEEGLDAEPAVTPPGDMADRVLHALYAPAPAWWQRPLVLAPLAMAAAVLVAVTLLFATRTPDAQAPGSDPIAVDDAAVPAPTRPIWLGAIGLAAWWPS